MKSELDSLKADIEAHLNAEEFVVFHSLSRLNDPLPAVHWDTDHYPDFKLFLRTAKKLDVPLVTCHHRELDAELIDDVLVDLENANLPPDEERQISQRLSELRVWEGFTNAVEISFHHEGLLYIYAQRADWYEEILEIADEVDNYLIPEDDEDDDQSDAMGGYFSRN